MKRKLPYAFLLFLFCTGLQAQVSIIQCAPDDILSAGANCEVVLPDYTGLVIAEDVMMPGEPLAVTQDPIPGTIITDPTTIVTFTADSIEGSGSCQMTFTMTLDPAMCLTYVPDDNFEQVLIDAGYDTTGLDNFVPTANIASVQYINGSGGSLFNKGITDFTGIEDFVSLIQLWSEGNPVTSIDLSKNTNLETIIFTDSQFTNLDLSANTKLLGVTIVDNQLQTIDLSANNLITRLSIANAPLTSIDISGITALETLLFNNGTQLTSVDLSSNTVLTSLSITNTPITNLDVSTNTVLESIKLTNTQLTAIDVSANTALLELYCENNNLTSLNLSTNTVLEYLYCNDNGLTALDLSANPAMEELEMNNNQLASLNLQNGNNLSTFSYVSVLNNPNLSCIQVDDETAANAGTGNYSGWDTDMTVTFAEVCTTCEVAGTTIASQSELDDFITLLGSCNVINGNLTIRNANDITDLSGLAGIKVINGKLSIGDNDLLLSLNGLGNLKTVTDGFSIFRNDMLTDINPLSGISSPINDLSISDNPLLTDITSVLGFTITELLRVDKQTLTHALTFPNVTSLTGDNDFNSSGPGSLVFSNVNTPTISIPNLTMVENFFTLRNVTASTVSMPLLISTGRSFNVNGLTATTINFDAVQSLGSFTLQGTQLVDLTPFASVTSLGKGINILDNPNLTTLAALDNVATTTDVFLNVSGNDVLASLEGLEFISEGTGFLVIENNPLLANMDALASATSTGYFRVKNNTILDNVNGLQNLAETTETDMGEFLQSTISGNALTSINLKHLRSVANQLNIVETGVTDYCGLFNYVSLGDGATKLDLTGSNFTLANIQSCDSYSLQIKAFLQGAALNPNPGEETLMRDDLRVAGLLPTTSPYGDGVTIDASVFTSTGNDAIVDWVQVAITDSLTIASNFGNGTMASPDLVLSGLIQRDGDIVSPKDGVSNIVINQDDFFFSARIAIRHRNHLTVSSRGSGPLSIPWNFKNNTDPYFLQGTNSQTTYGMPSGVRAMWAGDANGDGTINLIGGTNDTNTIRDTILNDPINLPIQFYGFNVTGYTNADTNLTGGAQIIGTNNDANLVRDNILNHPINSLIQFYGFTISEQLPSN